MKKPKILISLVTQEDTSTVDYGRRILSVLYDHYPKLSPEIADFYEPVRNQVSNVDEALEYWNDMIWKRKHAVKGEGTISHKDVYGMGRLRFDYQWNKTIDWLDCFQRLIEASKAEFAYIHLFTEPEIFPAVFASPEHDFQLGVSENSLKNGIPNLGWANYFAGTYADKVDVDLLEANGFEAQKLGRGYLLNITPKVDDVLNDFQTFSERRETLKSLFTDGVFAPWNGPDERFLK